LKQQACRGHEVVFYDQVGCGESQRPERIQKTAPWLYTIEYYTEELRTLIDTLGWQKFHLLGHSWGTIVGQAYAFQHDPRLQGIVLSGPLSDGDLYVQSQWSQHDGSMGSLPDFVQAEIHRVDAKQQWSTPLFTELDKTLTSFFTCRTFPLPDCFVKSAADVNSDIYVKMQGPSEFNLKGVLAGFNFTPFLPSISNPVLLTHGKYDTMRPPCVDALYHNLPRAWKAELPHSGHLSMIDDPKMMNDVVASFFHAVENSMLEEWAPYHGEPGGASVAMLARRRPQQPVLPLLAMCGTSLFLGAMIGAWGITWYARRCSRNSQLLSHQLLV